MRRAQRMAHETACAAVEAFMTAPTARRWLHRASRFACGALLSIAIGSAHAAVLAEQSAAELDEATRTRLLQFETDLDAALVSASDAASLWLRGLFTRTDDEARAHDLATAHRLAPREILYLASLASECQVDRVPRPAGCAESDWVAKWVSVDGDNAAPWVLLAARSLRIRQPERAVADLVQAAGKPRYDEYWNRSVDHGWTVMRRAVPSRAEDASGVLLLWRTEPLAATAALQVLCSGGPVEASDEGRDACRRLAGGAMSRADTLLARRTAAAVSERLATDGADKTRARRTLDDLTLAGRTCGSWLVQEAGAQERRAAVARLQAWMTELATSDEASACAAHAR